MEQAVYEGRLKVNAYSAAVDQKDLIEKGDISLLNILLLECSTLSFMLIFENNFFAGVVWEHHPSIHQVVCSFICSEDVISSLSITFYEV